MILTPESPEDQAEIVRLAAAGEIDVAHSFGDQPDRRSALLRARDDAKADGKSLL